MEGLVRATWERVRVQRAIHNFKIGMKEPTLMHLVQPKLEEAMLGL